MCGSCASSGGGFGCHCTGGDVFGVCPASKGYKCSVCGHESLNLAEDAEAVNKALEFLIDPAAIAKAQAEYKEIQSNAGN